MRSPHGVMSKVLDCSPEASEFELQLCNYVHFRANTHGKSMNPPLYSPQLGIK